MSSKAGHQAPFYYDHTTDLEYYMHQGAIYYPEYRALYDTIKQYLLTANSCDSILLLFQMQVDADKPMIEAYLQCLTFLDSDFEKQYPEFKTKNIIYLDTPTTAANALSQYTGYLPGTIFMALQG